MLEKKHNNIILDNLIENIHSFEGLSPNKFYLLYSIHTNNKELFNAVRKSYNSEYYFKEDMYYLLLRYIINEGSKKYEIDFESLKLKSEDIFLELSLLKEPEKEEPKESFIDNWYALWPKGIRSGDYPVRSGKAGVKLKMDKFRKEYPEYTDEDIIEATKHYIYRFSLKGYAL